MTVLPADARVPILLVDDRRANLLALQAVLGSAEYELVTALSGEEAIARVAERDFAVALLDVQMPTMDGFDAAARVRNLLAHRGRQLPIIFVTAIDTAPARILQAYSGGAVDFIQKPFEPVVLRSKVAVFSDLYRARERTLVERAEAQRRLQALTGLALALSKARSRDEVSGVVVQHGMRAAEADTCTLYVLDESGTMLDLIGEHGAPPEVISQIRHLRESATSQDIFRAMKTGTAIWAETDEDYRRIFPDLANMKASGRRAQAFWSMPLIVEGRTVGLLGMGYYEARVFSSLDRSFVEAFAQQAAQALLRALHFEREEEVRGRLADLERRDRARSAFLARAGEALVASLDYQATLATVARLAVPELADWCTIHMVQPDSGVARQVVVAHRDPAKERFARELGERYPTDPSATAGAPQVIRSGLPELYPTIPRELLERAARDAEHERLLSELRLESAMVVPLRAHGHTLGAATFVYAESGHRYTEDDLAFARDFARLAALAIENAIALKETEDARERERTLRALAEGSERMFREVVENMPDLAWTARSDGHVDFYNRRGLEFTGRSPEQMKGWGWREMVDPAMVQAVVDRWTRCLETGEPFEMEFRLQGADDALRWFLTRAWPLREVGGRIVRWFGVNTDIDDRRRSDDFREVFLGILGHELRNPLNTILLTARLLLARGELSPKGDSQVRRLVSSGERMQRMIDQILDMARARLGGGIPITRSTEEQDLVLLVTRIVDELRGAHPGRTIDLRVDGPFAARVDGDRFEQVVANLLSNALAHGAPDKPVTVTLQSNEHSVRLAVHNHGEPIDREFIPFLFNPFARGEKPVGRADGLGLGLYISERIVSAHGGKVEVDSSRDGGTRFEVTIPRRDSRIQSAREPKGRQENL